MTEPEQIDGQLDIGDVAEVPEDQRVDVDDDDPNTDADDDFADLDEGEVCTEDLSGEA